MSSNSRVPSPATWGVQVQAELIDQVEPHQRPPEVDAAPDHDVAVVASPELVDLFGRVASGHGGVGQDRADEPYDGHLVGEEAYHPGPASEVPCSLARAGWCSRSLASAVGGTR
jgi:hypothetical protein